ncbi:MAG: nuclear transport factor 2 family protein [Cryomorphaceae bacterium]
MWKYSTLILLLLTTVRCSTPEEQELLAIRGLMENQVKAWNQGDIDQYMHGYWESDELTFTGGKEKTMGYAKALERYHKAYPTQEKMGHLAFEDLDIQLTGSGSAFATGRWKLLRRSDTLSGRFTLVWRKFNGNWRIIADHSS